MNTRDFSLTALLVAGLFVSTAAHAQFRPGSIPDGGRIGAVCNDERFKPAEKQQCTKMMRNAKTDKQRDEVKALIQERLKERQKEYDEGLRRNENDYRPRR